MRDEVLLTTTDNPYNPFTQYDMWYGYDINKGYHTCSLLARVAKPSDSINDGAIYDAMVKIVRSFPGPQQYLMVTSGNFDALVKSQQ
jgi:hypothetical protein